ncbi:MAG: hypothetical protein KBT89_17080 [Gammaproteobacteria bacterium]|nr:hypothetical protein [Gammaproteobacteria bacterium]
MEIDQYDDTMFRFLSKDNFLFGSQVSIEYREDCFAKYDLGDALSQPQHWISVSYKGRDHRYNWFNESFRREDRSNDYIYDLEIKVCEMMRISFRKLAPLMITICHYRNTKGYIFWARNKYVSFKIQRKPKGKKYTIKPAFCEEIRSEVSRAIKLPVKWMLYESSLCDALTVIDSYLDIYSAHLYKIIKQSNDAVFPSCLSEEKLIHESIVSLPPSLDV